MASVTTLRKTAMICYEYAFEVSPTLKNICSYLFDKEGVEVDVYLDQLYRERHFKMPGANIIEVLSCGFMSPFVRKLSEPTRRKLYKWYVRRRLRGYERIIVADFAALALVDEMGADLSRVVYVSLESADYIRRYPVELSRRLLGCCSLRIIQSSERAEDLIKSLGLSLTFVYLPVSSRPTSLKRKHATDKPRIIYSGYLADWACLNEFATAFKESSALMDVSLTFHGHAMGTEYYLDDLKTIISGLPNVDIDTGYYDNAQYIEMLSNHDIGIVFYKNIHGSTNFENLILSSGKIANYLWSGMAVITNIDSIETRRPPFIYMVPSDADKLRSVIETYSAKRGEYIDAAYYLAKRKYDFDAYMDIVYEKMMEV